MKSNPKSPYTTSFNSAIKRGMPCGQAVQQIAKRTGKNINTIFTSLFNAGQCYRAKMSGQWVYWPVNSKKSNSTFNKQCQVKMWQNFIDWCIGSGYCTSKQFKNNATNVTKFMKFMNKNFNKMNSSSWSSSSFSSVSAPKSSTKSNKKSAPKKNTKKRTTKSKSKKSTWARSTKTTKSYKFPSYKSRKPSTKKYRQAA